MYSYYPLAYVAISIYTVELYAKWYKLINSEANGRGFDYYRRIAACAIGYFIFY